MKETKKSPYNLWQNSAFMVQAAWGRCKSVVPMCIALAVARAGQTVAELLIAPGILRTVETCRAALRGLRGHRPLHPGVAFLLLPGTVSEGEHAVWTH